MTFVCQHGAFRSRLAAAFFNAAAPAGWHAVSAGVTPQSEVSVRLLPLLAGSEAEAFIDTEAPRPVDAVKGIRTISIDADVPGAEAWRTGGASASDEEIRDEIRSLVHDLVASLPRTNGGSGL